MAAIAEAMALDLTSVPPPEPKKFTDRLLRRAGKHKRKR
jgi:hypothetical protein